MTLAVSEEDLAGLSPAFQKRLLLERSLKTPGLAPNRFSPSLPSTTLHVKNRSVQQNP